MCKTCDAVDHNIKSMYQLMAKCEELSKSMGPIYKLAEQMSVSIINKYFPFNLIKTHEKLLIIMIFRNFDHKL